MLYLRDWEPTMIRKTCYCCAKSSTAKAMDVDAALHELGMLSSSTESRKQFIVERNRTKSESASSSSQRNDSEISSNVNGYQIIQLNPTFVTGFMSELQAVTSSMVTSSVSLPIQSASTRGAYSGYTPCSFSGRYRQEPDSLEKEVKMHRLARIKLGRQRRFRKPYEVPWRLHHSLPLPESKPDSPCDKRPPDCSDLNLGAATTTVASLSTATLSKSNSSSPVKIPSLIIHRSKSLDDLDLARLKISELSEDQNFLTQRQEIEQMSENLKDLQMKE